MSLLGAKIATIFNYFKYNPKIVTKCENILDSALRLHPLKSVNARVADVPWISLCRFRRIAGYATESKSDRQGAAARRMVFLIKSNFLNII